MIGIPFSFFARKQENTKYTKTIEKRKNLWGRGPPMTGSRTTDWETLV